MRGAWLAGHFRSLVYLGLVIGALAGVSALTTGCQAMTPTHYDMSFDLEVRGDRNQPELTELPPVPLEQLGIRHTAGVTSNLYTIHDVDYVFLETFRLKVVGGGDLSWLGRVRFMLEAPDLPTLVLAYAEGFEPGQTSMEFETNDDELWHYFSSENYRIHAEVEDSRRPVRDVRLKIEARVNMRINIHAITARNPYPMMPY